MRTSMRLVSTPVPGSGTADSKQLRVRVQRIGEHVFDRPLLDDLARVHDEDVVGDIAGAREIVRDVEERDPALLLELQHQVEDPDPDRDVEHARRLVGEQNDGLDRKRARDRDALALAAGELDAGTSRRCASGGTRPTVRSRSCTRSSIWSLGTMLVDPQRPLDVVANRLRGIQRPERILEDHLHLRPVARGSSGGCGRGPRRAPSKRTCRTSGRTAARGGGQRCSCRSRSRRRAP